jgi:hypothetical protein
VPKLHIIEYARLSELGPMPAEPPLAKQTLAIGADSTVSAKFHRGTRVIRLSALSSCSIAIGDADGLEATVDDAPLFAGQTEFRAVPDGGRFAVAVISNDEASE